MKKIILILFLLPFVTFGQRVRDLATQASYDGSAYTIVDKAGWTSSKKMSLNILTGTEATLRKSQDTITRRGVGLRDNGTYIPDDATYYLTTALMSGYDTNSVMIAMHMLDSILHKVRVSTALWDTGAVASSVIQKSGSNTAVGAYSTAINGNNNAHAVNTLSMGKNSVAQRPYSSATSSGKLAINGDAQGYNYVMYGTTTEATTDTLEIAGLTYPILATDQLSKFFVDIVGVADSGKVNTPGKAFGQLWSITAVNEAGTTTLIDADSLQDADRSAAFMPYVTVEVNNATESLWIVVHGIVDYKIKWVAYIRETTVGFRNFSLGY